MVLAIRMLAPTWDDLFTFPVTSFALFPRLMITSSFDIWPVYGQFSNAGKCNVINQLQVCPEKNVNCDIC